MFVPLMLSYTCIVDLNSIYWNHDFTSSKACLAFARTWQTAW